MSNLYIRVPMIMLLSATMLLAAPAPLAAQQPPEVVDETADNGTTPAEETENGQTTDGERTAPRGLFDNPVFLVIIGLLVLMLFWSSRSRKKQEQRRQQMIASLKKGDKVTSIGGIIGTVIEVRENEVVVKVDESTNTKMKFVRDAIRVTDQAKGAQGTQETK